MQQTLDSSAHSDPSNHPDGSVNLEMSSRKKILTIFTSPEMEENFDRLMAQQKQMKVAEQIASAKRSLITNLLVAAIVIFTLAVMVILPNPANVFWIAIASTCEKGFLPILTTIANFKAIHSVFPRFSNYF